MTDVLDLGTIDRLTGGRLGTFDVVCPICGPDRRATANRRRKVLRIWRVDGGFAGYRCARCGAAGYARDDHAPPPDPAALENARAEAAAFAAEAAAAKEAKARGLWRLRRDLLGTPAEVYLRTARGYHGQIPATLGYLPASGAHPHAMIAAFGVATEPEPGVLAIADNAVQAVHITRLSPDGRAKAGTDRDKIMRGNVRGAPIVLAPANDGLGLAITEGIEDALSAHAATGLGATAAGAASFLPALADVVPLYIEAVTVMMHPDADGVRHSHELARRLIARGIEATVAPLQIEEAAA